MGLAVAGRGSLTGGNRARQRYHNLKRGVSRSHDRVSSPLGVDGCLHENPSVKCLLFGKAAPIYFVTSFGSVRLRRLRISAVSTFHNPNIMLPWMCIAPHKRYMAVYCVVNDTNLGLWALIVGADLVHRKGPSDWTLLPLVMGIACCTVLDLRSARRTSFCTSALLYGALIWVRRLCYIHSLTL